MIEILSPAGRVGVRPVEPAPGTGVLTGRRIAVLDNGKPHAGFVMAAIARLLAERTGASLAGEAVKTSAALPMEPDVAERLRGAADVVLTGSADCGSCTSWSVHDTVELERLGLPTVLLATRAFADLAREVCALHGLRRARVMTVRGPLGGSPDSELMAMAEEGAEQALRLWTET
ncbi:UGSC family (seleno)protein [Streptomyces sp. NPDC003006]